jgi:predicted nuclease of predicted toxin-antitoxin system
MPRTIRFHLDESADPRIAKGLRLHGVDISTTPEAGLLGVADDKQLEYATAEKRVIVSQDTDFLRIAHSGIETPGIVFFRAQQRSIGDIIRGLLLIWEVYEPDDMKNRVEYL